MSCRTFNRVYDAMKAIDPTIKVGGGATSRYDRAFLQTFLQQSGSRVDFVDFHGYAQEGTEPGDPTADTTLPHVEVFASDHAKSIVVLNMDQAVTHGATFSLNGATTGSIEVWRKDEAVLFPDPPVKLATLTLENGTFTYRLPPLSVTTFVLQTP